MSKKRQIAKQLAKNDIRKEHVRLRAEAAHYKGKNAKYRRALENMYRVSQQGITLPPTAIVEQLAPLMEEDAGEAY